MTRSYELAPPLVAPTGFATWWASTSAFLCGVRPSDPRAPLEDASGDVRRLM
jgi:hypothetical protein